jgi:thiamine-monophosphate kinase
MPSKDPTAIASGKRSELTLLARIRDRAAHFSKRNSSLRLGIGDDCALLRLSPGEELAVTTDLSVAGRHFQLHWHPAQAIGHRTLARGLSDLAAMGARPVAAFLSLGLPGGLTGSWLDQFLDGLFALAEAYSVPLAGGDLSESPIAVADIVLTGAVRRGKALLRSGAHPDDLLYVTGTLGGAAAALARLKRLAKTTSGARSLPGRLERSLAPHLYPQPRVAQGLWLARKPLATAAIDLIDGLSTDLAHLCQESAVAAEIDADALPVDAAATLAEALHGGEDYELLFTAAPSARIPRSIAGVPVTRIGRILRVRGRPQIALITARGSEPLRPHGWEHFS